jgi:hypothetical protein
MATGSGLRPVEEYTAIDEFNRYDARKVNGVTRNAAYDGDSNMTGRLDGSSCVYDAQYRLTSATNNGVTDTRFAVRHLSDIGVRPAGSRSLV